MTAARVVVMVAADPAAAAPARAAVTVAVPARAAVTAAVTARAAVAVAVPARAAVRALALTAARSPRALDLLAVAAAVIATAMNQLQPYQRSRGEYGRGRNQRRRINQLLN